MSATPEKFLSPAEQQKLRTGLDRIVHAAGFSLAGLRAEQITLEQFAEMYKRTLGGTS